jgi:starch phosphorylase
VWRELDPVLWELTHNPWVVLQTVSREKLQRVLADGAFPKNVDDLVQARRDAAEARCWFQQTYPQSPLSCVAYFSMEFMLSEALPINSGGLDNVAGDQLNAASDLGVPVIGVGLLYQQGYFRQVIDRDGGQQALFPYNDPGQLPITSLRKPNGEWLRLEIGLPGYPVWLRVWQVQELYADGVMGSAPMRQEMKRARQLSGASGGFMYRAAVPAVRPPADYTARVIPHCDGVSIPLEDARILWQR